MALWKRAGKFIGSVFGNWGKTAAINEKQGDRLEGGPSEAEKEPASGLGLRGRFSRRYLILASAYLITIVVLLAIIVIRFGMTPPWEIPGFPEAEKEAGYQSQGKGEIREEMDPVVPGDETGNEAVAGAEEANIAADSINGEQETADIDLVPIQGENEQPPSVSEESVPVSSAAKDILPQAATPLPQWSLQSPFGSYLVEELPSGGSLHRFTRGAFLQASPAAPVYALWAGKVLSIAQGSFPRGLSVLLEHEGGYCTYYGNLSEVWVEKGSSVSEGEGLGLLPHSPPAAGTGEFSGGNQELPMRSVWSGYYDQESDTVLPALQPNNTRTGNSIGFYGESPLLYLEVRFGQKYLDPLEFIPDRY